MVDVKRIPEKEIRSKQIKLHRATVQKWTYKWTNNQGRN
jgi:hypothetical protein